MNRNIKIAFRWLGILLLLIFILIIAGYFLIQDPKIQTKLVQYYTTKLSSDYDTEIQVGEVDFKFFNAVTLNDIYVEDLKGDTLLYVGRIHTDALVFQPFKNQFAFTNSQMEDVKIRLRRAPTDSLTNLAALLNNNKSEGKAKNKKSTKTKDPLGLTFSDINIKNFDVLIRDSLKNKATDFKVSHFTTDFKTFDLANKKIEANYIRAEEPFISLVNTKSVSKEKQDSLIFSLPEGWEFNLNELSLTDGEFINHGAPKQPGKADVFAFNHFDLKPFTLQVKEIKAKENQLELDLEQLSFVDKTGFRVDNFSGNGLINPDDIVVNNLLVQLDESEIRGDIKMNYQMFDNFSDFENKIDIDASIEQFRLMPREFTLLLGSEILKEPVTLSGELQGKINNLSTQDFNLEYQNGAVVRGDIDARGLPDIQNTFFDAVIDEISLTQSGLQQIMGKQVVPEQVKRFGNISYTGEFLGYISDLIAFGTVQTDIGALDVDVKYTTNDFGNPQYSGFLSTDSFKLGYWLDNPDLGDIDFSGSVSGTNFDLKTMDVKVDANINSIEYQGNKIDNVDIEGELSNQVLTVEADVDDEIFTGLVNAELNYGIPVATLQLDADVKNGDLQALGLMKDEFLVNGKFALNLTGNSVRELQGDVGAQDAMVFANGKEYKLGDLGLVVEKQDGKQVLAFNSENASAKFIGNYNYTQFFPTILQTISAYYDFDQGWEDLENTVTSNEELGFEVEIDPNDELIQFLLPDLKINSGVNAQGLLNPATDEISILALADSLSFQNISIIDWKLDAFGDGETLYINSFQDNIENNGKAWLTDSDLNVELSRENIFVEVRTYNDKFLDAKLTSSIERDGDEFKISILTSDLIINGERWDIQKGNSITLGGKSWEAENFVIKNGDQSIEIFNPVGQEDTKLVAAVNDFHLTTLNSLVGFTNQPLGGDVSGNVILVEMGDGLNLDMSLVIENLMYNNDIVAYTVLEGLFDFASKQGSFDGVANDENFQFTIDSQLDLSKKEDILQLNIDIDKASISPFGNLWASSLSGVEGFIDGNMQIVGGPSKFNLAGEINVIEDILMTLKFSQARYRIPAAQTLKIERDGFVLDNLILKDPFDNTAIANGKIVHQDLSNFTLDIEGEYDDFLFLNTTSRDNEVLYGTAFASGTLNFTGPVEDALLSVNATSEENTTIYIQASSGQNTSTYEFLRFRTPVTDSVEVEVKDQSKLTMNFDLDILPSAEVNMYFDSEGYNSLRGNGFGTLLISLDTEDTSGSLQMNGIYEVNQGAYAVNFKDIFERDFDLLPGGFVQWGGDPFNANIEIPARYSLEADISALSPNNSNARFLSNAETDLNVTIKGLLSNPLFDYQISIDRAQVGSEINDQIGVINDDPTKLDNQIGSLLLLKRFSSLNSDPFSSSRSNDGVGIALNSVTDILTSHLTSLLSETGILRNTDIDFDYDNYQDLLDQGQVNDLGYDQAIQIQLSHRLLNDRIEIEYGGDFNFGDGLDDRVNTFEVGDFVLTYKLSDSGNYKFTLFSRRDFSVISQEERRRNGFGFLFQKDFNKLDELFQKEQEKEEESPKELPPEELPALPPDEEGE